MLYNIAHFIPNRLYLLMLILYLIVCTSWSPTLVLPLPPFLSWPVTTSLKNWRFTFKFRNNCSLNITFSFRKFHQCFSTNVHNISFFLLYLLKKSVVWFSGLCSVTFGSVHVSVPLSMLNILNECISFVVWWPGEIL